MAATIIIDYQNCFIFIFVCIFSRICYSHFFTKPKDSQNGFDLPPSPPSLPIIGHLHLLLSLLIHKSLHKVSSKYGPLLYLRIFNVPILLVSSAKIAYEIFKTQDVNISSRDLRTNEGSLFFGSSGFVMAPYGDYSKFMKKLLVTKLLGPQALERSRGVRAGEVKRFYSNLLDKAVKKESAEIGEEAMKLITNTICKIVIGKGYNDAETVRGLVTESDGVIKKFFVAAVLQRPLKKLGISLFKKELTGVSHQFDELLEKMLMEYEEDHQGTEVMDALLAAYGDENTEYKITRNHIKSVIVDLLVAGVDTSTHSIKWIMAEIINNPKVGERLREEIDLVVGKTRLIQETDLPNVPYLQAVVKEGLRLHPPSPFLVRTFQERCELKGFYIPEKTKLLVNGYAIMRDHDFWEDPEEFKPERFLASSRSRKEDETREEVLKYLPFGSGRRSCVGSALAYASIGTAIGVMVQCFDWRIDGDKVNMDEAVGAVTLSMAHPLKCTPVPRTLTFCSVD